MLPNSRCDPSGRKANRCFEAGITGGSEVAFDLSSSPCHRRFIAMPPACG
jgi:hypothetical protein